MVVNDGLRVIRDVLTQKIPHGDVVYADGRPNQGHRTAFGTEAATRLSWKSKTRR